MSCVLTKFKADTQKHGILKIDKGTIVIQIDLIENLPGKNPFILMVVDIYSRYITPYLLSSKKTSFIVNCLINYISIHGSVKFIVSDNFSGFKSKEFQKFLKTHNIIRPESAPYRSRSRSMVENYNGIIQRAIKCFTIDERESWANVLPICTYLINNRPFENEKLSPMQIHFGVSFLQRDLFRPEQKELFKNSIPQNFWEQEVKYRKIIEDEINSLLERRQNKQRKRQAIANINKKSSNIHIGNFVVIKDRSNPIGVSSKLVPYYEKVPYEVLRIGEYNVIVCSLLDGTRILRSIEDIKLIKPLNNNTDMFSTEIIEMLQLITEDNIIEIFHKKQPEVIREKIFTRLRSEQNKIDEAIELQEDLDDFDEEIRDRLVKFDDNIDISYF